MNHDHALTRRGFLGTAAAAGMAATARPAAAAPAKTITTTGTMPEVEFGKTGHKLPVFCQGTATIIQSEGDYYGVDVPRTSECIDMIRAGVVDVRIEIIREANKSDPAESRTE